MPATISLVLSGAVYTPIAKWPGVIQIGSVYRYVYLAASYSSLELSQMKAFRDLKKINKSQIVNSDKTLIIVKRLISNRNTTGIREQQELIVGVGKQQLGK